MAPLIVVRGVIYTVHLPVLVKDMSRIQNKKASRHFIYEWLQAADTMPLRISVMEMASQSNIKIAPPFSKMARNLDLRCVLVSAPWVLGPKHVSNPE